MEIHPLWRCMYYIQIITTYIKKKEQTILITAKYKQLRPIVEFLERYEPKSNKNEFMLRCN